MSLRYSIYKVQCSLFALADSFLILAHSVPFVKNFFQVFSNFFAVFRFRCLPRVSGDLNILADLFSFVKNFFQVFSNFFEILFCSCRPRRQLAYISTDRAFCQALFQLFLILFILRIQPWISGRFLYNSSAQYSSSTGPGCQIAHVQASQRGQVDY